MSCGTFAFIDTKRQPRTHTGMRTKRLIRTQVHLYNTPLAAVIQEPLHVFYSSFLDLCRTRANGGGQSQQPLLSSDRSPLVLAGGC